MGLKSPASETAEFVSVFRSGSCSEKGPKQYMEDEYICVDDLHEHLGQMENLPSPGAFYGVCNLLSLISFCVVFFWSDNHTSLPPMNFPYHMTKAILFTSFLSC